MHRLLTTIRFFGVGNNRFLYMASHSLVNVVLNRLIDSLDNLEVHDFALSYLEKLSKSDDVDVSTLAEAALSDREELSSLSNFLVSLKDVFSYLIK